MWDGVITVAIHVVATSLMRVNNHSCGFKVVCVVKKGMFMSVSVMSCQNKHPVRQILLFDCVGCVLYSSSFFLSVESVLCLIQQLVYIYIATAKWFL